MTSPYVPVSDGDSLAAARVSIREDALPPPLDDAVAELLLATAAAAFAPDAADPVAADPFGAFGAPALAARPGIRDDDP